MAELFETIVASLVLPAGGLAAALLTAVAVLEVSQAVNLDPGTIMLAVIAAGMVAILSVPAWKTAR